MLDQMVEHARREAPNECVGVIGTRDGGRLVRGGERRRSPLRYEIAPQELLRVQTGSTRPTSRSARSTTRTRARRRSRRRPTSTSRSIPRRCTSSSAWRGRARRARVHDRGRRGEPGGAGGRGVSPRAGLHRLRDPARPRRALLPRLRAPARPLAEVVAAAPPLTAAQERARKVRATYAQGPLVRVAAARNQPEASCSRACCSRTASRRCAALRRLRRPRLPRRRPARRARPAVGRARRPRDDRRPGAAAAAARRARPARGCARSPPRSRSPSWPSSRPAVIAAIVP